ncbi:MAG: potassium channel family protein [Pseudomonadota bacterium]
MLLNLSLGVAIMALCLGLQIALLTRALMYYAHRARQLDNASFLTTMGVMSGVMLLLVFGNLAQVALWALLFQLLGEFEKYATAFYFSAVNFATLGYGDIVMSERWRLLGPLQAMNGVLMIGVSTAAFMNTLRDAVKHSAQGRSAHEAGTIARIVDSA